MSKTDLNVPAASHNSKNAGTAVVASIHGKPVTMTKDEDRPSRKVAAFVREHPFLMVAGGIAVGAAATALLPRPFRSKLVKRAVSLAELAGSAALAMRHDTEETAIEMGASAKRQARRLSKRSQKLSERAAAEFENVSDRVVDRLEDLGAVAFDKAAEFSHDTMERASHLGHDAAKGISRLTHKAERLRSRILP